MPTDIERDWGDSHNPMLHVSIMKFSAGLNYGSKYLIEVASIKQLQVQLHFFITVSLYICANGNGYYSTTSLYSLYRQEARCINDGNG